MPYQRPLLRAISTGGRNTLIFRFEDGVSVVGHSHKSAILARGPKADSLLTAQKRSTFNSGDGYDTKNPRGPTIRSETPLLRNIGKNGRG